MYLLVDVQQWQGLQSRPDLQWVESYPAFVLIYSETIPSDLPSGSYQPLTSTTISLHGRSFEIPDSEYCLGEEPHTVLRFIGPMALSWREKMRRAGIQILCWAPPFGALARLPADLDEAALRRTMPFISGAQPYREADCSRGLSAPNEVHRRAAGLPDKLFDLVCFSREDRARVEDVLRTAGVVVLARSSSKLRIRYEGDPAWLRDQVGVKLVDATRAARLVQTGLSGDIGLTLSTASAVYRGRGQVIAVADTGLDIGDALQIHQDFSGRVRQVASWPINDSWAAFVKHPGNDDGPADRNSGHGTHVAGLALGDGGLSDGRYAGVAPEAELVFQSIEQFTEITSTYRTQIPNGYYLSGRPLDLRQLLLQAREFGARIHVNAWGDPAQGAYTDDCFEADLFLHEHPDAVVLFAAGNDGADRDGNGVLDAGSLYAPASAKNVIAVGATEGGQAGVGLRGDWSTFDRDGRRFSEPGERRDLISGESERIALFSSTGPTADGRIKPDLCAPGTNLVAPRSRAISSQGWGLASPMPHYMYFGGSSMATGVAGGAVAVLREAWAARLSGRAPGGAAIKALLIAGCQPTRHRRDNAPEPRHVAGFGRIWLDASLPDSSTRRIQLYDEQEPGLLTGERRSYRCQLNAEGDIRAVLCWYDAPGEALVNDLDLCLVNAGGQRVWGNHAPGESGTPDRSNTVEVIDAVNLPAGDYTFEVTAFNVPESPQPYALVIVLPPQQGGNVPIGLLRGIGKSYGARLDKAGITGLQQLLAQDDDALSAILSIRGRPRDRLIASLALLRHLLASTSPLPMTRGLTLARLLNALPPEGVSPADWAVSRQSLLPLLTLFDTTAADRITLGDLYS